MRCVCPMGGDRTCPDNCLIAAWHGLPDDQRTKARRLPLVEALAKQGYTQQAIAMQLGVSQKTISNDLVTLVTVTNVKGQGKDTKGRKKSTGRRRSRRQTDPVKDEILADLRNGKSSENVAAEHGVKGRAVRHLAEDERIRKEALDELLGAAAAENFSEKGTLRIEDAIRIHKARLEKQFEQRVNEEVRRRIAAADDAARADNKRLRQENITLTQVVGQQGVLTETQYRHMLMLCHPDSSAGPELKAGLLQVLLKNKLKLIKGVVEGRAA